MAGYFLTNDDRGVFFIADSVLDLPEISIDIAVWSLEVF
jgi:hypothetical protein